MVDRDRVLARMAELDGYLSELRAVLPESFEEYTKPEKKRACERLLQISVGAVVDICHLLAAGLRLGLPPDESEVFTLLRKAGVFGPSLEETLKRMKGFRNILVHQYGEVDDRLVYAVATSNLSDFATFRAAVLEALAKL